MLDYHLDTPHPPLKRAKVQKSLGSLLQEVSKGEFEAFRSYLAVEAMQELDLYGQAIEVDLTNLGKALQHSCVKVLRLGGNRIDAQGAKDLSEQLYATQIQTLDLTINCLGNIGVRYLMEGLSNSPVKHLILGFNQIDDEGLKDLSDRLPQSQIQRLSLCSNPFAGQLFRSLMLLQKAAQDTGIEGPRNQFTRQGIAYLFNKLPQTHLRHLNIRDFGEHISNDLFVHMSSHITQSSLISLMVSPLCKESDKRLLNEALEKNRHQRFFTPYYACALGELSSQDKAQYFKPQTPYPSTDKALSYAGGILMHLPKDLLLTTLSHLPLMDYQTIKNYQAILSEHHPKGIKTFKS